MTRLSYEEYLRKYHTLTYKNVGVSMLPLLKQGRDSFTVREVNYSSPKCSGLPCPAMLVKNIKINF